MKLTRVKTGFKILVLILLLCIPLLLTGCWDLREPEDLAIVLAVGYDYNPATNMYNLILQIESPVVVSGGQTGGGGGNNHPYWTVSAWGYTPIDAIANIRKKISREIYYNHLQLIIISEEMAKTKGIVAVIDALARSRQSRPIVLMAVGKGDIKQMLSVGFPIEMTNAQGLINQIELTSRELGRSIIQVGRKFYYQLFEPGIEPVASYLELINEEETGKFSELTPYTPPFVQLSGLAAFQNDVMVGSLNERETRGWGWLQSQGKEGIVNITYPENENTYLTLLVFRDSFKIEPYFNQEGSPAIKAQIKVSGNILAATGMVDFKEWSPLTQSIENRFAETIRNDIIMAVKKAQLLKSDIFGFGNAFYRKYYQEWLKMEDIWPDIFAKLPVDVDVRATIRRTGMINQGVNYK